MLLALFAIERALRKGLGVQKAAHNSCKGAARKIIRESPSIRNQVVPLLKLLSDHHAFPRSLA